MSDVAGRVSIKADGQKLINKAGSSLDLGGERRTPVVSDDGVVGFSTTMVAGELTVNLIQTPDTDVDAINKIKNATGSFMPDAGKGWLLTGLTRTDTTKLTPGNQGDVALKFSFVTAKQVG